MEQRAEEEATTTTIDRSVSQSSSSEPFVVDHYQQHSPQASTDTTTYLQRIVGPLKVMALLAPRTGTRVKLASLVGTRLFDRQQLAGLLVSGAHGNAGFGFGFGRSAAAPFLGSQRKDAVHKIVDRIHDVVGRQGSHGRRRGRKELVGGVITVIIFLPHGRPFPFAFLPSPRGLAALAAATAVATGSRLVAQIEADEIVLFLRLGCCRRRRVGVTLRRRRRQFTGSGNGFPSRIGGGGGIGHCRLLGTLQRRRKRHVTTTATRRLLVATTTTTEQWLRRWQNDGVGGCGFGHACCFLGPFSGTRRLLVLLLSLRDPRTTVFSGHEILVAGSG